MGLAALASCREPTQITLVVTSDVPCDRWKGAGISVGAPSTEDAVQFSTTTETCNASGAVGTLVLVPSGSTDDTVAIRVVAGDGRSPDSCRPPAYGVGCIVARRRLHFLPHTALTLDIELRAACNGVACGPAETCDPRTRTCVTSAVDPETCRQNGCDDSTLDATIPVDGAPPVDGAESSDAADDRAIVDAGQGDVDDGAVGAIGWPCDANAQCSSTCCCIEVGGATVCDQRTACTVEAVGCL